MKRSQLSDPLFAAAEADARFSAVLKKIQQLQAQLPDEFDPVLINIVDKFRAVQSRLQSAKYDLLILFRNGE